MTDKITLATVANLQDTTTAVNTLNNNFAIIQAASNITLSRDGTQPNPMLANLDMNSNQILNLPAPATVNSPARLIDVVTNPTIVVPPTGTSGNTVPFLNGNNTWSGTNTFSAGTTFNGTATFNGAIAGLLIPGWNNQTYNPKTTNYTAVSGDNGSTISLGGNTLFTLTFGAASGYTSTFQAFIVNADAYPGGRGKTLAIPGFGSFILWPGQNIIIYNRNNVWDIHPRSQRWVVPSAVTVFVDTAGNDSNDGLASGSGAFATLQAAQSAVWNQMDHAGTTPTISPTAGQTFAQSMSVGGQPVGNNLCFIQGNGGAFTWQTPGGGGTMLAVGDNAEVSLTNIHFVSSNNIFGQAAVYLHNNGLADMNTGLTFTGGGVNDTAIFTDNNSNIFTVSNGFTCSNTFGDLIHMDGGGGATISGLIAPSGSTQVGQFIHLKAKARASMGTQPQQTGYISIGASVVEQQSLLITNGVSIPGGTSAITGGLVL